MAVSNQDDKNLYKRKKIMLYRNLREEKKIMINTEICKVVRRREEDGLKNMRDRVRQTQKTSIFQLFIRKKNFFDY